MSKMKFSNYQPKQSRIVEGVCVPISHGLGDYDELLREADAIARRIRDLLGSMKALAAAVDICCSRAARLAAAS